MYLANIKSVVIQLNITEAILIKLINSMMYITNSSTLSRLTYNTPNCFLIPQFGPKSNGNIQYIIKELLWLAVVFLHDDHDLLD